MLAEGADAAVMTRSIPIEKMLKDAIIAYGQNGEAIRPEQDIPYASCCRATRATRTSSGCADWRSATNPS